MISDPHKTIQLKVGGKTTPVWLYGNPKNRPILFIHGYLRGFSDYIGDLPIRYLMKDYYVIAFDLPGFGYSEKLNISGLDLISNIQEQIINNKKVTLFGISYGGLLSLKYAYKYKSKVNSLIIAGTPVLYGLFKIALIVGRLIPKYRNMFKEFGFINKNNLSKIKTPVLLYYNRSDYIANVFMGKKLQSMIYESKLFISDGQNHKWLLHRIDKNGFLEEIKQFLK